MNRARLALFGGLVLAVALALAFFAGPLGSSQPDGLERVAIDSGFAERTTTHVAGGPLTLVVTHDLLYALQLCPRAVVMNHGSIVADGRTRDILADAELMAAHRLELPYGCVLPA